MCWIVTAMIAFFICFVQIGFMACLLAGRAGIALVSPMALLVALLGGCWITRRCGYPLMIFWRAAGVTLGLLALALALSAFFYDLSWDGQWYHQAAIINIARDWNPLTDPLRSFNPAERIELWLRHYAKGPWYFAAAVYLTTGHVEWGKAIDWLSPAVAWFAVLAACIDGGLRSRYAVAIATVVAINPVVMSEATTYLVDGVMISFLVVVAASIFTCLRRPNAAATSAGVAATIVAINAKFTGLVYLCFLLAAAVLWCFFNRRQWLSKFALVAAGAVFLGVCVWGYNPYITNTIYRQQPFYPMLGSAKYPSIEQQGRDGNEKYETPKNMVGRSRLIRFGYATFGRPGNQPYRKGLNASLMWPFTARPDDLYAYTYHETRLAGFGPLFSGCFILAFALAVCLLIQTTSNRWLLLLLPATIIASLLISKHLWWPRYGPQFWLMPVIPLVFALREQSSSLRKTLTQVVLVLLLVDASIVAFVRLHWETSASFTLHTQLREMRDSGLIYEVRTLYFDDATNVRLTEAGVKYRDIGLANLPNSHELTSVVEGYPAATHFRAVGVDTTAQGTSPDRNLR